ncbi:unnamed protein product [Mucor hiemalis]
MVSHYDADQQLLNNNNRAHFTLMEEMSHLKESLATTKGACTSTCSPVLSQTSCSVFYVEPSSDCHTDAKKTASSSSGIAKAIAVKNASAFSSDDVSSVSYDGEMFENPSVTATTFNMDHSFDVDVPSFVEDAAVASELCGDVHFDVTSADVPIDACFFGVPLVASPRVGSVCGVCRRWHVGVACYECNVSYVTVLQPYRRGSPKHARRYRQMKARTNRDIKHGDVLSTNPTVAVNTSCREDVPCPFDVSFSEGDSISSGDVYIPLNISRPVTASCEDAPPQLKNELPMESKEFESNAATTSIATTSPPLDFGFGEPLVTAVPSSFACADLPPSVGLTSPSLFGPARNDTIVACTTSGDRPSSSLGNFRGPIVPSFFFGGNATTSSTRLDTLPSSDLTNPPSGISCVNNDDVKTAVESTTLVDTPSSLLVECNNDVTTSTVPANETSFLLGSVKPSANTSFAEIQNSTLFKYGSPNNSVDYNSIPSLWDIDTSPDTTATTTTTTSNNNVNTTDVLSTLFVRRHREPAALQIRAPSFFVSTAETTPLLVYNQLKPIFNPGSTDEDKSKKTKTTGRHRKHTAK